VSGPFCRLKSRLGGGVFGFIGVQKECLGSFSKVFGGVGQTPQQGKKTWGFEKSPDLWVLTRGGIIQWWGL